MARRKKKTLGAEIAAGLSDLCDAIDRGESVRKKFTVKTVELNLEPAKFDALDVREVRGLLNVSQAIFAKILGTSVECVENWEQGLRTPPAMACRLLELIRDHREHWSNVVRQSQKEAATA
jgi:DNA-binding transcriptional regulator YiaG